MRGVTLYSWVLSVHLEFLLTRLMRGVTKEVSAITHAHDISTHTPHARRDTLAQIILESGGFLLTRLMRGVTFSAPVCLPENKISTHTPHARRDTPATVVSSIGMLFLLTRLMRGVTSTLKEQRQ